MSVDESIALLRWYDGHRRALPWRCEGGQKDPYGVWLSEIMLQQTTVAAVRPYYAKFLANWPTVQALAAAPQEEVLAAWAGLGYYARARNLIACARAVTEHHGGRFPDTEAELAKLPGIGRYTAAAIAAIAFDRRAVVVDTNVERVIARLFAVQEPLPASRAQLYALADRVTPEARSGDFAQAMMDLGATICTPRRPACAICPMLGLCAAPREGRPEAYPVKRARPPRPHKRGIAYWLESEGHVLLVRRPGRGLLGGMMALPGGPWGEAACLGEGAPSDEEWLPAGSVNHVFTHFALDIDLFCARSGAGKGEGIWWPIETIEEAGLPTLFRKLATRGRTWSATA